MEISNALYYAVFIAWVMNALLKQIKSFWLYSLLSLPGTFLHESCHALVGFFTKAKPVSFTVIPKRTQTHWVFGSVGFANLNSFNALPSAMAPLLILLFPYEVSRYVDVHSLEWYQLIGLFFLTVLVTHSAIPSIQDFKVALSKPLGLVFWGVVAYWVWYGHLPNFNF